MTRGRVWTCDRCQRTVEPQSRPLTKADLGLRSLGDMWPELRGWESLMNGLDVQDVCPNCVTAAERAWRDARPGVIFNPRRED